MRIMRKEVRRRRVVFEGREEEGEKGMEMVSKEEDRRAMSERSEKRRTMREESECEERRRMRWDVWGRVEVRIVARHLM